MFAYGSPTLLRKGMMVSFLPQLSDFVPSTTVSAHRLTNITLLTVVSYTVNQGESPTYNLNEDTHPVIRAIGVSPTAWKD